MIIFHRLPLSCVYVFLCVCACTCFSGVSSSCSSFRWYQIRRCLINARQSCESIVAAGGTDLAVCASEVNFFLNHAVSGSVPGWPDPHEGTWVLVDGNQRILSCVCVFCFPSVSWFLNNGFLTTDACIYLHSHHLAVWQRKLIE